MFVVGLKSQIITESREEREREAEADRFKKGEGNLSSGLQNFFD